VFRLVREPPNRLLDIGRGECFQRGFIAPGNGFGERGAGGDGGRATPDFEARPRDTPVFDERGETQDIAADGVRNLNGEGWRGKLADVTRILEVLDQLRAHARGPCSNCVMTAVVAGVLERDGKILIGRRRADQAHPLKWEFPGGKLEAAESPQAALERELGEELGIEATAGEELMRYEFTYPGKQPILLIFVAVASWRGEVQNRIFETIAWERPEALPGYDFLEGDARFLGAFTGRE